MRSSGPYEGRRLGVDSRVRVRLAPLCLGPDAEIDPPLFWRFQSGSTTAWASARRNHRRGGPALGTAYLALQADARHGLPMTHQALLPLFARLESSPGTEPS